MEAGTALVALDIETTGLDLECSQVRAVGVAGLPETAALASDDEARLLRRLEDLMSGLLPTAVIVTWNGAEFDMPFLAFRFHEHRIATTLRVTPTRRRGKYGGLQYEATWGGRRHLDLAEVFREWALTRGVQWSLKPVARAFLGINPVEVDRRGEAIKRMDESSLLEYVISDAEITLSLARAAERVLLPSRGGLSELSQRH